MATDTDDRTDEQEQQASASFQSWQVDQLLDCAVAEVCEKLGIVAARAFQ